MRASGREYRVLAVALWMLLFGVVTARAQAEASGRIDMTVSLPEQSLTLHEPVLAELSVHNGLLKPIRFSLDNDSLEGFELTIVPPTGKAVRQAMIVPGFHVGGTTLQAGEDYHQKIVLSRWYQFPVLGRYKIEVKMVPPVFVEGGALIRPGASEALWLEVKPRDPDRLKRTCDALAERALQGPDPDARSVATLALAYVQDVVAVPFLARVAIATGGRYESPLVKGLARIANVEGLEAVLSALGSYRTQLEAQVREGLRRMRLHISVTD